MVRSQSSYFLLGMILLSLALGLFISYFFVFVNALFISEIGTSKLPFAYLLSGFGGLFISWLFNSLEKKWGFAKTSTLLGFLFSLVIFSIWYFYNQGKGVYYIIFFAYAWFWISTNFTALVFWKLPSNIFNLEENKKYNSIISSGEGISAIIAYLSVPVLLTLDFFTRDMLVLISFVGMFLFSVITFFLGSKIQQPVTSPVKKTEIIPQKSKSTIFKEPYFRLIFYSVVLSIVVQFLIDFSLMEVSANQMKDTKQLAQYFSFIFGGMRVIELTLKFFISKYLISEHGVFISLTSLIFALTFIVLVGLTSFVTGYLSLILIVASLGKVFERSFYRSIYAPTINLLYQAYPSSKRSLTQNYADGYGKTIGQLIAALFILAFAQISEFENRILTLLLVVLGILLIWFIVSKNLISHYKSELTKILNQLKNNRENQDKAIPLQKNEFKWEESKLNATINENEFIQYLEELIQNETISARIGEKNTLTQIYENENEILIKKTIQLIEKIKSSNSYQLTKFSFLLNDFINKNESKSLELILLFIQLHLILNNESFSFHHSQNSLKKLNFLYSAVIQNYSKKQKNNLEIQDYYFLLEERVFKYTYLVTSLKEVQGNSKNLDVLLNQEINTTKLEILFCLSLKHDANTLEQIVSMIDKGTKSEELLALELLELMLDEQEKKWVLPLLKESNFDKVLSRVENDFPQVLLGIEDRLISLITTKKVDIPNLIRDEALKNLTGKYQNPSNEALISVLIKTKTNAKKAVFPDKYLTVEQNSPESQLKEKKIEFDLINLSQQQVSLSYFYWQNDLSDNPKTDEKNSNYNQSIKLLYKEVFPMEKLNL